MDERGVDPVVGQLVDVERAAGLAVDPGPLEEFLAKFPQGIRIKFGHRRRIRPLPPRECRHVGQFHRPFYHAVTGKNLLDQGRPRTRHAQDEDRIGRGAALPGPVREERRRIERDRTVNVAGGFVGIVVQLLAAQGVPIAVVRKSCVRLAAIFERLAQRKVEVEAVFRGKFGRFERGLHHRDILGSEAIGLEIGEAPPRFPQRRHQFDRAAIGGHPFVKPPHGFQHVAIAHPYPRLARRTFQNIGIDSQGILEIAEPAQRCSLKVCVPGVVRFIGDDPVKLGNRLFRVALAVQHQREIGPRRGERG